MIRFTLLGNPIQIQPFFWITLAILGGALRLRNAETALEVGLFVIAGFSSILVHELGHALAGRAFGARSAITLHAFGGYAQFTGTRFTRTQSFLVTVAGPLVQIIFGLIVWLIYAKVENLNENSLYLLRTLTFISFVWALLNLLPVLPLDGGQLLNAALGPQRLKITLWVSIVVAVAAALFALATTNMLLFPIFLGMMAWENHKALRETSWR